MSEASRTGGSVTVRQVAERAGVSRQTVSNVLNAPERVDPTTRARVRAAIDLLGYRPNRSARSLKTRKAGLIGYCLARRPGLNPFMDVFLHALCGAVEDAGHHVLLFSAPDGEQGMGVYGDLVAQRAVDAFFLSDTVTDDPRPRWLNERGIRFASFGRTGGPGPWVDVDGATACAELVAGLFALGHRDIAFIGWSNGMVAGADRLEGWRSECDHLGLPAGEDVVVRVESDTMAAGEQAAALLLGRKRPPTAIVTVSDLLAVGALREVVHRGLKVGEDVAVTGFDDSVLACAAEPGLTTVRQPIAEIAATLVQLLQAPVDTPAVLLPGEIVSRGSAPVTTGLAGSRGQPALGTR
jgi:DNA-binding LacI/PurR family transcriptional regulator